MAGQTFTTYINAKRAGSVDSEFQQLGAAADKSLSGITKKAQEANRALAGLTGGRGAGGQSPISSAYLQGFDQAKIRADRLAESQARLSRENSTLVRGLRTTGNTLQVVQGPLGPIAGRVNAAADAMVRLSGATLGLGAAGAALFAYLRAANSFAEVRNKLVPFFDTQTQVNQALENVYGIAQRARLGLSPVADLYGKLKIAADQYGISAAQVQRTTELAAKAASIGGGPNANKERGLYQFTQAIGTGKLQGQDLRALLEDTPLLGREIALGIGKLPDFKGISNGSVGAMRELAKEGKITADVIIRALDAASTDIEERFKRLPPTLSSAFQNLSNSATMFVGHFEESTHIVSNLAEGIILLGNNLNVVVSLVGGVAAGFGAVAAAGKFKDITTSIQGWTSGIKASQVAAQQQLTLVNRLQASSVARLAALKEEQAAIEANVAALEAEVVAQKELSTNAAAGAKAGLPGAVNQQNASQQRAYEATKQLADERSKLDNINRVVAAGETQVGTLTSKAADAAENAAKKSSLWKTVLGQVAGSFNLVGVAVGLATTAFLEWATAESEAERNAHKIEDAQRSLGEVIDFTTGKVREQSQALLAAAKLQASQGQSAAEANYSATRARIAALAPGAPTTVSAGGAYSINFPTLTPAQQRAQALLQQYGTSDMSTTALQAQISALAKSAPELRQLADQVTALSADAINGARKVDQLRASVKILTGTANADDIRRAQGDYSGGKPQGAAGLSDAQLNAQADALAKKLDDARFAAKKAYDDAVADLKAKSKDTTTEEYVSQLAEIKKTYHDALQNIADQEQAKKDADARDEARRERAHQAELKRIEEENKKREERTTRRADILGRYNGDPTAVAKAQNDIRTLNDLVGQTMNGLAAITKDNPLGQGIYTKAMAEQDRQNIVEGLEKPYREYMDQRRQDAQISQLIANGHDLEAAALQEVFALHKQIGVVTMSQYHDILASMRAEQDMNDILASRERIMAPLKASAENFRNDIVKAIEEIEGGMNPLKSGTNFLKSILSEFNHATAVQLGEKLTAGLDKRVRDLINGSTSVDTQIASYLDALNKTSGGAVSLAEELKNTATAAGAAADKLNSVANAPAPLANSPGNVPANDIPTAVGAATAALNAILPSSFYKSGVKIGGGVGDNIIFKAIGGLGAVITENLRSQATQNALFKAGKTTARVSDHTTTDEAYDVRLPVGMSYDTATNLIRKTASEFGYTLIKALNETTSGGTGPHAHYVFGPAAAQTATPTGGIAGAVADAIGGKSVQVITSAIQTVGTVASTIGSALSGGGAGGTGVSSGPDGAIIITGKRPGAQQNAALLGTGANAVEVYNQLGQTLGTKLDSIFGTKFLGNIGSKLGTALQGAQYGQMASSVLGALGVKQSSTGSAIGGAAGSIIGSFIPGVGTVIGGLVGGVLGGTIGGLFQKTKQASSTVTGSGGQISVGAATGSGDQQKQGALQGGNSVSDALQSIADQLGATIGNFAVSVGIDKKGHWRVDPQGLGRTWHVGQSFDTEEEAVQAAVADAIQQGAITGISAASQTILRKSTDLQKALNKVLVIESIPKQLMQLTDPVRFAVTELNTQFAQMISYLKEGGATAEQFAQAQQLYDLERAKAIQEATQQAGTQIKDYINNMLGGTDSPLNKRTVYQNAQAVLKPLADQVNAGKPVDTDALLKAVQDFQAASQNLNGSSSSFFDDFNSILTLLNKAQALQDASSVTPGSGAPLPPSPFDDAAIQAIINPAGTIQAINDQTNTLSGQLTTIANLLAGAGGGSTSAIDLLPGSLSGAGGGSLSSINLLSAAAM